MATIALPQSLAMYTRRAVSVTYLPLARHEFQCDGVQFKVLLTQECIDQACGLIFDVHGWLSNPDEQEARSNLARVGTRKTAVTL